MILIVDDNQENIFSLKTLLEINQFKVDTASSGAEALRKILRNSYSLIILDVQMPEMDGFEVAEAVSGYSKSKDIPIIFLSAVNTHKRFVAKGYDSGGIDYVTKPFDPDILLLKIRNLYRMSEQTRRLNAMERDLRHEIELRKKAESVLENKVTDRTRELMKANQLLLESNKDLQQFAYIASHDLQEPLRKIQTFTNLILEKYLGNRETTVTYLEKISDSASRLRNLVINLLEYSRLYNAEQYTTIDLNQIIDGVVSDLELQIRHTKCNIRVSKLPVIEGVPHQLRQVFQNLLSNSIKFSATDRGCSITISGERVKEKAFDAAASSDGEYCRIIHSDNGIGFREEFSDRIFEIFQRLNAPDEFEGTGIGLAIVKRIVDRHDGLITASSENGKGARFTIILPVNAARLQTQTIPIVS